MKTKTKVALIMAACAFSISLFARAEPPDGARRRGPPPEAIEACENASAGDACVVDTPHGTLEGTCRQTPRNDELACVPNDHRPPRGNRDDG